MHTPFKPQKTPPPAPAIEPLEAAAYAEMQANEAEGFAEEVQRGIGAAHRGTLDKVARWLFNHHCMQYETWAVFNRRLGFLMLAIQAWADRFSTLSHWHNPEDQRETDDLVAVIVRAFRYISPEGVRRGAGNVSEH